MAGFCCPHCRGRVDIFNPSTGGAKALCDQFNLNLLGSLPLDPSVGAAGDSGSQLSTSTTASEDMSKIVAKLRGMLAI